MKMIDLNENYEIDLDALIDTRLLIQANSGGGKSWCIRRLLEQSHGKVQQIVIDLEGEFSTLREKYDYILAGKGGDVPADPRSAALLAKRLLELNVSAIIDLYELDHFNRKRFVKLFLDALVDAPKELWHPCLVVVDEAHFFCPEKGQSEAMSSVIELATRGRKRGFSAILATQRLSKLHKDAAAECNNKLIGRTGLDVDMKRASEELGFTTKEQYLSLRALQPGEFFAFGPAISTEVIKTRIGKVETTHPKAGSRILTAPPIPPTSAIKSLLGKLTDLPQEAEQEAKTVDELRTQNMELKRQLRSSIHVKRAKISDEEIQQIIQKHVAKAINQQQSWFDKELKKWAVTQNKFELLLRRIITDASKLLEIEPPSPVLPQPPEEKIETKSNFKIISRTPMEPIEAKNVSIDYGDPRGDRTVEQLALAPRKIYSFLYANSDREFSKVQIGAVTGYSHKSGGFNNALAQLNSAGLIQRNGNMIKIGTVRSDLAENSRMEEYSPELWIQKLGIAPRKIYEYLWSNPHDEVTKERLGEITGYSYTSGGFNNALARLNSLGLITRLGNGLITLNKELLEI